MADLKTVLTAWRKQLSSLSKEDLVLALRENVKWFGEGDPDYVLDASLCTTKAKIVDFIMKSDPIVAEGGLLDFLNMYLPSEGFKIRKKYCAHRSARK